MATPKNSIFDFADKFGYNSPFATDWVAEEAEKRAAREAKRATSIASLSTSLYIILDKEQKKDTISYILERLSKILGQRLIITQNSVSLTTHTAWQVGRY